MCKKIAVAAALSVMLSGCGDDGVDAPNFVKKAQKDLDNQMKNYVSLDLSCYRQQFEQRWFVLCFDRNDKRGPAPLYEVVTEGVKAGNYLIHPANGKASQYAEARFNKNYIAYAYDETPANVKTWDVIDLFRQTYPPKTN